MFGKSDIFSQIDIQTIACRTLMWLSCVGLHTHPDGALFQPTHCQRFSLVTVDSACLSDSFPQMCQTYKCFGFVVILPGPQTTNNLFHLTTFQTLISLGLKAWINRKHKREVISFKQQTKLFIT